MKLEHTPALAIALRRALALARHEGLRDFGPVHLLRGLLAEDEGHCAAILRQAGLDWAAWRHSLPQTFVEIAADDLDVSVSAAMRHLLNLAREESSAVTEEGSLSSDQVLLALLADNEVVRRTLENCGLDYESLRRANEADIAPLPIEAPIFFDDSKGQSDAARIVDASANRAREALRVLEDHARFVLNDALHSRVLKEMRHELAQALAETPAALLLAARDTEHDVGTAIATEREQHRASLTDVLQANAKRLQESLRSLEEYGKILSPALGLAAEKLRYRSYTLEKSLVLASSARQRLADARLYVLVTEALCRVSLAGTVREAIEGGADVIQLREKNLDDRTLLHRARDVRGLTRRFGVLFIVNDRPDIALLAEADGVHLGQEDLPLQEARRLLGPDALFGVSTHNLDQMRQAVLDGASYVGVGPTFPSQTKDFVEFAGLDFVRRATAETTLPAFALGGITIENVEQVVSAGARRVAVSQAICGADDPRLAAQKLKRALAKGMEETSMPVS